MGCNSSQVHVQSPQRAPPTAEIQSQMNLTQNIIQQQPENPSIIIKHPSKQKIEKLPHHSWCFLFGETSMQRKIVCFDATQLQFTTVSSKYKIPEPPVLKYHPIEPIFEQSQELFSSSLFSKNSRPPYNFMLALWIDAKKVFLCGGINFDFDFISNEAFVYDTSVTELSVSGVKSLKLGNNLMGSKFQKLSFMGNKRYSHMGVVYAVGLLKYVYVFGGRGANNELMNDCQKYSVTQNKWTKIAPMKIARSTGFSFVYRDRIYVCGGYSAEPKRTKKIEVYHPDKDYWQTLEIKMHRGLETGSLFSIKPNELLFIGGNLQYGAVNSVVQVNLKDQTYIAAEEMNYPRVLEKGCITNEKIIIFGGNLNDGLEIYNYSDDKREWVENNSCSYGGHIKIEEMNSFSYSLETVEVEYQQSAPETSEPMIDISDERTLVFSTDSSPFILDINFTRLSVIKKPVPMALRLRSHMGCQQIKPGKYWIGGGVSEFYEKPTRCCYLYFVISNKAIEQPKMISARYSFATCVYRDEVYVFGGKVSEDAEPLYSCQKLSDQEGMWVLAPSLVVRRHSAKAVLMGDKIFIVGGSNGVRELDEIEVFDPERNSIVLVDIIIKLIRCVQVVRREEEVLVFGGGAEDAERMFRLEVKERVGGYEEEEILEVEHKIDNDDRKKNSEEEPLELVENQKNQILLEKQNQHEQQQSKQQSKQEPIELLPESPASLTLKKQDTPEQQLIPQVSNPLPAQQANQHSPQNLSSPIAEPQPIPPNPSPSQQNLIPSEPYNPPLSWELTAQPTFFQAPPGVLFSTSFATTSYFISTDCVIHRWQNKVFQELSFQNSDLLQNIDFERVTFS